ERVVVADARPTQARLDAELVEEVSDGTPGHLRPAVRVHGELASRDAVPGASLTQEALRDRCELLRRDRPTDDEATKEVKHDVEREEDALGWSGQLGDVPSPDLIRCAGDEPRHLGLRMPTHASSLAALVLGSEDTVHRADGAVVHPLVEQHGVHLRWCPVHEPGFVQRVEHDETFGAREGPRLDRRPAHLHEMRALRRLTMAVERRPRDVGDPARSARVVDVRGELRGGQHHGFSLSGTSGSGIPRRACTFFWNSMMMRALRNSSPSFAFSRSSCSTFFVSTDLPLGPRLRAARPLRTDASRCCRQCVRCDEYRLSLRSSAPTWPGSVQASTSRRIAALYSALNARRRRRTRTSASAEGSGLPCAARGAPASRSASLRSPSLTSGAPRAGTSAPEKTALLLIAQPHSPATVILMGRVSHLTLTRRERTSCAGARADRPDRR